jgi:hypothetical protein
LRAGTGLQLSEAVDGVSEFLEELVRTSTAPAVRDRIRSAPEFLEHLVMGRGRRTTD